MAEIRQKIISCPEGHYYDANKYASCPFCANPGSFPQTTDPLSGNVPSRGVDTMERPGRFTPTIDPVSGGSNSAAVTPTVPAPQGGPESGRMGKTQYVDVSSPDLPAPIVGWLVEVEGKRRGTDYRLHSGYNYIGRERGDVCLRDDDTISAENDSTVSFVPQTGQFFVSHLQGKNVVLVNHVPVPVMGAELKDYDVITIGRTELLFIGLCGERFNWQDEGKS